MPDQIFWHFGDITNNIFIRTAAGLVDVRFCHQSQQLSTPLTASSRNCHRVAIVTSHVVQRANQLRVSMTTSHAPPTATTITHVCRLSLYLCYNCPLPFFSFLSLHSVENNLMYSKDLGEREFWHISGEINVILILSLLQAENWKNISLPSFWNSLTVLYCRCCI